MQYVIFEDGGYRSFGPLTALRPTFDLRCGALLLREKLELRRSGSPCVLIPRAELGEVVAEAYPGRGAEALTDGPTLLLSARVVADDGLLEAIAEPPGESLLTSGGAPVGAVLPGDVRRRVGALVESGGDLAAIGLEKSSEVPARVVSYPWELVHLTAEEIESDASALGALGRSQAAVHDGAHVIERSRIALGAETRVGPGAVLDARRGPVLVGRGVEIMPNAFIEGPASIGDDSVIRTGATVYGGVSVGGACKVGGEVAESVLHSFSNKQHGGFLGHSYLGSWVNLGAGTDNSDLKNNYGTVRVEIDGETVETGSMFVGATIGDHSKTAIGTTLNTGTVVGIFCNVVAGGFPPKAIRSFSWGGDSGFVEHDIDRAIETARRVMARRDVELTPAMERLIRRAHAERR
jgi:UDP-N-acetylglucosamine diphosphorylase/glucosamine-1-phosphate N-acetyltransferase